MANKPIPNIPVDRKRFKDALRANGYTIERLIRECQEIDRTARTIHRQLRSGRMSIQLLNMIADFLHIPITDLGAEFPETTPKSKRHHTLSTRSTYMHRRRSNLITWMMDKSGTDAEAVSKALEISKEHFSSKLNRDSFSIEDVVVVSEACGYSLVLMNEAKGYRVPITSFGF